MSIGKRSRDFASLSFSSQQDRTLYTVPPRASPVLYVLSKDYRVVLSINLGTPLFRLLKGFGTSASAAKWGPANGRREGGRGRPSGGAESGFAAIIRREGMVDRRYGRSSLGLRLVPNSGDNRQDTRGAMASTKARMHIHANRRTNVNA